MDIQTYKVGTRVDVVFDPGDRQRVAVVGVTKAAQAAPKP
jgi:hypothetical protein